MGRGRLNPEFPVVQGRFEPGGPWSFTLPGAFNVRVDPGNTMVVWRPGVTVFLTIWNPSPDVSGRDVIRQVDGPSPVRPGREQIEEVEEGGIVRLAFRNDLVHEGGPLRVLALVTGPGGHAELTVCFDDEADASAAWSIVRSVRQDVQDEEAH